jgi:hypothetical protein
MELNALEKILRLNLNIIKKKGIKNCKIEQTLNILM